MSNNPIQFKQIHQAIDKVFPKKNTISSITSYDGWLRIYPEKADVFMKDMVKCIKPLVFDPINIAFNPTQKRVYGILMNIAKTLEELGDNFNQTFPIFCDELRESSSYIDYMESRIPRSMMLIMENSDTKDPDGGGCVRLYDLSNFQLSNTLAVLMAGWDIINVVSTEHPRVVHISMKKPKGVDYAYSNGYLISFAPADRLTF